MFSARRPRRRVLQQREQLIALLYERRLFSISRVARSLLRSRQRNTDWVASVSCDAARALLTAEDPTSQVGCSRQKLTITRHRFGGLQLPRTLKPLSSKA